MGICNSCKVKSLLIIITSWVLVLTIIGTSSATNYDIVFNCNNKSDVNFIVEPDQEKVIFKIDECSCAPTQELLNRSLEEKCLKGFSQALELSPEEAQFWRDNPIPTGFLERDIPEISSVFKFNISLDAPTTTFVLYCVPYELISHYVTICATQALNLE